MNIIDYLLLLLVASVIFTVIMEFLIPDIPQRFKIVISVLAGITFYLWAPSVHAYSQERLIERMLPRIPYCSTYAKEILIKDDLPYGVAGSADHESIWMSDSLTQQDFKETLVHECGHLIFDHVVKGQDKKKHFGRYPYVTNYAKTNEHEDFAETYMIAYFYPEKLIELSTLYKSARMKMNIIFPLIYGSTGQGTTGGQ